MNWSSDSIFIKVSEVKLSMETNNNCFELLPGHSLEPCFKGARGSLCVFREDYCLSQLVPATSSGMLTQVHMTTLPLISPSPQVLYISIFIGGLPRTCHESHYKRTLVIIIHYDVLLVSSHYLC